MPDAYGFTLKLSCPLFVSPNYAMKTKWPMQIPMAYYCPTLKGTYGNKTGRPGQYCQPFCIINPALLILWEVISVILWLFASQAKPVLSSKLSTQAEPDILSCVFTHFFSGLTTSLYFSISSLFYHQFLVLWCTFVLAHGDFLSRTSCVPSVS